MLNVELAKPFVDAAFGFLHLEVGLQVKTEPSAATTTQGTSQEINIIIGITGSVSGQMIYSMSLNTAKSIAGMMLGRQIDSLDRTAQSALCELGNMISGMAITRFDEAHSNVALTPPSLVAGKNIFISILKLGCMRVSLVSELGTVDVTIALEEKALLRQAEAV
ncbi:MAG: hypothetical protein AUK32_05025 [Candidatus Aquicultor secundus]|nr:chemotaxis protein CheX [Candidatus Aquicultor secundus]NCO65622.1 hypothetical protein [Solirubrobacter sp.]OIO86773.1 MAG: hypothetical protein AUK32_05025 [Candidatus Aquicultor secundus]